MNTMSVVYEPRNFIHEGAYPPIGDEHDHGVEQRFTDSDVAEQLSHYTTEASLLPDDRGVLGDDRGVMGGDQGVLGDDRDMMGDNRDVLGDNSHVLGDNRDVMGDDRDVLGNDRGVLGDDQGVLGDDRNMMDDDRNVLDDRSVMGDDRGMMPEDAVAVQEATHLDLGHSPFPSPMQTPMQASQMGDPLGSEEKELSPDASTPPSSRVKPIPKPDRDAVKQTDGKYHCPMDDCKEDIRAFSRKCEWK